MHDPGAALLKGLRSFTATIRREMKSEYKRVDINLLEYEVVTDSMSS